MKKVVFVIFIVATLTGSMHAMFMSGGTRGTGFQLSGSSSFSGRGVNLFRGAALTIQRNGQFSSNEFFISPEASVTNDGTLKLPNNTAVMIEGEFKENVSGKELPPIQFDDPSFVDAMKNYDVYGKMVMKQLFIENGQNAKIYADEVQPVITEAGTLAETGVVFGAHCINRGDMYVKKLYILRPID